MMVRWKGRSVDLFRCTAPCPSVVELAEVDGPGVADVSLGGILADDDDDVRHQSQARQTQISQ